MDRDVVLITGANNGLGLHLTRHLANRGYRVAALDLSTENLEPLAREMPEQVHVDTCNVADFVAVESAVERAIGKYGRVNILINNAVLAVPGLFEQKKVDDTRREFEVNFFGCLNTIRAVLPHMKRKKGGIIHNVSSGVGITGFKGIYGYTSSKGALEALSKTLSYELKPYGISVTAMHPPLMHTKSSSFLGLPAQVMDDPAKVAARLSRKVTSAGPVITPDFRTRLFLLLSRLFPYGVGGFLSKMAERASGRETR